MHVRDFLAHANKPNCCFFKSVFFILTQVTKLLLSHFAYVLLFMYLWIFCYFCAYGRFLKHIYLIAFDVSLVLDCEHPKSLPEQGNLDMTVMPVCRGFTLQVICVKITAALSV